MAKRLPLPLLIKSEYIYREKPKTFFQELLGLKASIEKCGCKDFYTDGKVIVTYTENKPFLDGYTTKIVSSETYYLSDDELKKMLDQRENEKQEKLQKLKENIIN
ncbi:hypothetical protein [Commensalibacter communis]|uniref:hypothetical protein n=1 Tax=Commensalibacter communis TaxID=2972786 RepID=UPI0022FF50B5|nr:hypothetical protein [Commensalibacter communis]CAI3933618.1 unnamed protein product [Commensalibacter communis]CAI3944587.1 unnamed protein product [Commensalibacter communis]